MILRRQSPDELLQVINEEADKKNKGHLKIFFGYAAGVGKTYAMLQAAHMAKKQGVDVVAGYIEPHARPQTIALLKGLEQIPNQLITYNGIKLKEFDLDAAIKRHPQIILVDELAHTNAVGCRHTKRYQDIKELLKAGIDVYTTVNVQHIESLNDIVASITGVRVRERIPDSVFDDATQVELVDIEPQELLERLDNGQIYKQVRVKKALNHFFTVENLTALREIALRRCADRVNILSESVRTKSGGQYHTDEHILVGLSSAPSNAKIIRTAARMAKAFKGTFTATYVETPELSKMTEENKKRLQENIRLAQQLGANIEIIYGEDIPLQIAEFSRLSGVSKVVIGRSAATKKFFFSRLTLTEKLIEHAPNLDIYIIPDQTVGKSYPYIKTTHQRVKLPKINKKEIGISFGNLALATCLGFLFEILGFSESNIIIVYILGVLFTAVLTSWRGYSMIASLVSVLIFNFLFTHPKFTFFAYEKEYPVTFLIMFIAAFLTSSLTMKLKNHAKQSARIAYRTKILFDTNHLLERVKNKEEIIEATASQLIKLLNRDLVIYLSKDEDLLAPRVFYVKEDLAQEDYITENEKAVATWVLRNNKRAGATTDTLSSAICLYLSIRINETVYGVIGIMVKEKALDAFEQSVLLSILGECALALENEKNRKEREEAAVLAQKEQLRANLLRSISHDLRTPLTSISGNASNLISNGSQFDAETKMQLYTDIYDDAMWLINLVENLLSVTRIEEEKMNLRISPELIDEVISEALHHVNRLSKQHVIRVHPSEEMLLTKMDARLIVQVIINIVDNAIKYTPAGSKIDITSERKGEDIWVSIADNGEGIANDVKLHIFDMFYTGAQKVADSRRSLGLGLSLCKSIIHAHGGIINVSDHVPQGAVFTFTLKAFQPELDETLLGGGIQGE